MEGCVVFRMWKEMFTVGPEEGDNVLGFWDEATLDGANVGMELKLDDGSPVGLNDGSDDERNVGFVDISELGE